MQSGMTGGEAPIPKPQRPTNDQAPMTKRRDVSSLVNGAWALDIDWSLGLGHWGCTRHSHLAVSHPMRDIDALDLRRRTQPWLKRNPRFTSTRTGSGRRR